MTKTENKEGMTKLSQEEIDKMTREYLALKEQSEKDPSLEAQFKQFQNYCVDKLKYLVQIRAAKYKKFSNYPDLAQDGFEALILAFNTFDPDKGCFTWWADKYISTRISRAANAHSTIRFPIKKAKELRPYKTSTIPVMIDWEADPFASAQQKEDKERIREALKKLPEQHRIVLNKTYGFNGERPRPVKEVIAELDISRPQYTKILREAKEHVKQQLMVETNE